MKLEVKMLCSSNEAIHDAAALLGAAGFDDFRMLGGSAAYDATLLVEVDDGQMDVAPMGGVHILDAVGEAVWCACDGIVEELRIERAGLLARFCAQVRRHARTAPAVT